MSQFRGEDRKATRTLDTSGPLLHQIRTPPNPVVVRRASSPRTSINKANRTTERKLSDHSAVSENFGVGLGCWQCPGCFERPGHC